jgi:hypothetical protein
MRAVSGTVLLMLLVILVTTSPAGAATIVVFVLLGVAIDAAEEEVSPIRRMGTSEGMAGGESIKLAAAHSAQAAMVEASQHNATVPKARRSRIIACPPRHSRV